jgi:hypothetical protein
MIRSYSELLEFNLFEDRFHYLALRGGVGEATFGFDRYINQQFYRSREWKQVRQHIIARDNGCDLGIDGYEIYDRVVIHHMNPMTERQIIHGDEVILDPEFLITVSNTTHTAIHYGDEKLLPRPHVARTRGDTKLW